MSKTVSLWKCIWEQSISLRGSFLRINKKKCVELLVLSSLMQTLDNLSMLDEDMILLYILCNS